MLYITFTANWTSDIRIKKDNSSNQADIINVTATFSLAPKDYGFNEYRVFLYLVTIHPDGTEKVKTRPERGRNFYKAFVSIWNRLGSPTFLQPIMSISGSF